MTDAMFYAITIPAGFVVLNIARQMARQARKARKWVRRNWKLLEKDR